MKVFIIRETFVRTGTRLIEGRETASGTWKVDVMLPVRASVESAQEDALKLSKEDADAGFYVATSEVLVRSVPTVEKV